MMNRNKKILLVIPAILADLILLGFLLVKNQRNQKQALLNKLIHSLEEYKSATGAYPADLSKTIAGDVDWLYYSPDSTRHTFHLAYSAGIMNVNTFRYSSTTKKWEEVFNY
jgi:hypothetical protein